MRAEVSLPPADCPAISERIFSRPGLVSAQRKRIEPAALTVIPQTGAPEGALEAVSGILFL